MKVIFLGVGEAFDERLANNSHLIISETTLLLDCGYSVPGQVWTYCPDPSFPDAIYISHSHADHYFGLPPLLTRMWEGNRTKPLTIICPKETGRNISNLIEQGYSGITERFRYSIHFSEIDSGHPVRINELALSFAPTQHPCRNHAVRVTDGTHSVSYSGDGMFLEQTENLYEGSDLLIHEAYTFDDKIPNHACITDLIEMAGRKNIGCIALTHLQRDFRRKELRSLREKLGSETVRVIIPEPFDAHSF